MDSYYRDHRVMAAEKNRPRIEENKMTMMITLYDEDGEEEEHEVPFKWEVCPTCEGKGSHVNPSIDSEGITSSEWWEEWGEEEREYYCSGNYDVPCYECRGKRVVPEPVLSGELEKRYQDHIESEARCQYERAQERSMGY